VSGIGSITLPLEVASAVVFDCLPASLGVVTYRSLLADTIADALADAGVLKDEL